MNFFSWCTQLCKMLQHPMVWMVSVVVLCIAGWLLSRSAAWMGSPWTACVLEEGGQYEACMAGYYYGKAQEAGDPRWCLRAEGDFSRCVLDALVQKAIMSEDREVCGKMGIDTVKKACEDRFWWSQAMKNREMDYCTQIEGEVVQESCMEEVVAESGEPQEVAQVVLDEPIRIARIGDVRLCMALSPMNRASCLYESTDTAKKELIEEWCSVYGTHLLPHAVVAYSDGQEVELQEFCLLSL